MSKELITNFYKSFQQGDGETMGTMYHEDAKFSDEVFKNLTGAEVGAMWSMLLERSKGKLKIEFHSIVEAGNSTSCIWEAKYPFSKTGRKGHNVIRSQMTFKDGKIIDHLDRFNFWKWTRMALGASGILLGWTPFLHKKVRQQAHRSLAAYLSHGHR